MQFCFFKPVGGAHRGGYFLGSSVVGQVLLLNRGHLGLPGGTRKICSPGVFSLKTQTFVCKRLECCLYQQFCFLSLFAGPPAGDTFLCLLW